MGEPIVFNLKNDQVVFVGPFEVETITELQFKSENGGPMHWKIKANDNSKFRIQPAVGAVEPGGFASAVITRTSMGGGQPPAGDKLLFMAVDAIGSDPQQSFQMAQQGGAKPFQKQLQVYYTMDAAEAN